MKPDRIVFVHGSGRAGVDAWPNQVDWPGAVFLTRPGFGPGERPVTTDFEAEAGLVERACGSGAAVVAASYGGIAAIRAAGLAPTVTSLVLCEPAAFSLARGRPAVGAHIAAVEPIMRRATQLSAGEFQNEFFGALGIVDVPPPGTPDELAAAERLRLQRPPWADLLDRSVFSRVPTLVVTGHWNKEYEEVAEELVVLGAQHRRIEGFGHQPQDSPAFHSVVTAFWDDVAG
ncbi:MAG: alpha/beta hydrolase [Rhodoglobus sp.]